MPWVEGTVDTAEVDIHYVRTGDASKPPVVLLHGFTDNARCWTRVAEAIEGTFDVVMVDSRNHGESGTAVGSCVEMAADVAAVIVQLDLGSTVVIGHSLGASTATELAVRHPGLVRGLVLEDPPWRLPDSDPSAGDSRRRGLQAFVESFNGLSNDEILVLGRAEHPSWHDLDFPSWATSKQQVRPEALESIEPQDWAALVSQLDCPTLLIHGVVELGGVVGPEVAAEVAALNPLVTVEAVDGTGHNIRRERFESFVGHVQAFLAHR